MKLKKMVSNLDQKLSEATAHYFNLHEELDQYRGQQINDENLEQINKIINELQDIYADIHEVVHFVAYRHEFAVNIAHTHENFINDLIKAGAKSNEK